MSFFVIACSPGVETSLWMTSVESRETESEDYEGRRHLQTSLNPPPPATPGLMNPTLAASSTDLLHTYVRKFIVVEPEAGLGRRIGGVVSTAYLAYAMDRVLVIDWKQSNEYP